MGFSPWKRREKQLARHNRAIVQLNTHETFILNLQIYSKLADDDRQKCVIKDKLLKDLYVFCPEKQHPDQMHQKRDRTQRVNISATKDIWEWTRTRKFDCIFFESQNAEIFAKCLDDINRAFRAQGLNGGIVDLSVTELKRYILHMEQTRQNYRR